MPCSSEKHIDSIFRIDSVGYIPPKHQWTSIKRHEVTTQKFVLFIVSALRTSDPTRRVTGCVDAMNERENKGIESIHVSTFHCSWIVKELIN
jgi:hypothetical protein